ncbi:transcriptional regulator [Phyllobacterium salinisoli]|uniref:Transcriptional regulator n=2 Tax=Phyllobacterium salinisoli TaxID=1899321 RepID=A0A368JVZ1_9HYPH|nr:transcriptional regulator [Phyllobacterium salinisoli]
MTDPQQEIETAQSAPEATTEAEATETKTAARQPRKAGAKTKQTISKNEARSAPQKTDASTTVARTSRKIHSQKERAQILSDIEQSISRGQSIKSAGKQAGISEQTYYHWKKAAAVPVSKSNDLMDLLALEEENKRLKSLLAERLHKENAELRKKLGLE